MYLFVLFFRNLYSIALVISRCTRTCIYWYMKICVYFYLRTSAALTKGNRSTSCTWNPKTGSLARYSVLNIKKESWPTTPTSVIMSLFLAQQYIELLHVAVSCLVHSKLCICCEQGYLPKNISILSTPVEEIKTFIWKLELPAAILDLCVFLFIYTFVFNYDFVFVDCNLLICLSPGEAIPAKHVGILYSSTDSSLWIIYTITLGICYLWMDYNLLAGFTSIYTNNECIFPEQCNIFGAFLVLYLFNHFPLGRKQNKWWLCYPD